MDYSDDASDHNPHMEIEYPDIDEVFHYPWQGPQLPPGESSAAPVIDPRLYKDLFPADVPEQIIYDDVDDSSSVPGGVPQPPVPDDSSESYEFSGQETDS